MPNEENIIFTNHALEQMEKRYLRKNFVYYAWRNSREVSLGFTAYLRKVLSYGLNMAHTRYFWGAGVLFVVDVSDDQYVVITLYQRNDTNLKFK